MNDEMNQTPPEMDDQPPFTPDDKNERTWAMVTHLSALVLFVGIPFGNVLAPLIVWLIKRDEYPLVEEEGKEVLNFQLTVTIGLVISGILAFVFIGILLVPVVTIACLVLTIIGSVKTYNGEKYHYPLAIRFFK